MNCEGKQTLTQTHEQGVAVLGMGIWIDGVISMCSKIHHEVNDLINWVMISLNFWLYKYLRHNPNALT